MRGVILCGGLGTRLMPVTEVINKHLLPVYDKPMVYYPIQTLVSAGVKEILLVVGGPHAGQFFKFVGDGSQLGARISYAYQSGFGGAGEALGLAEEFSQGKPVTVFLGDFVCDADISKAVSDFSSGATVFLVKYLDPEGMGVPIFDGTGKEIIGIEENPKEPKSEYAIQGIYIYDSQCFEFIKELRKKIDGEIKPTHINELYLKKHELKWVFMEGFGADAGKFDRLLVASNYFASKK